MSTITAIRKRLSNVDAQAIAAESLQENERLIAQTQRDQLKTGLKGGENTGGKIGQYKSKSYAAQKFAQNPLAGFGNVDLTLTGDFANAIFVDVRGSSFVIESADSKAADLFKQYGEALGLNRPSRIIVIENGLKKTFVNNIKKATQL